MSQDIVQIIELSDDNETVSVVPPGDNSTTSDPADTCLETRYWFYFLSSSLVVFLAGLIAILSWRIFDHFVGCTARCEAAAVRRDVRRSSRKPLSDDAQSRDYKEHIGMMTRIKLRCEKFTSVKTFVGKILAILHCAFSIISWIIYVVEATRKDIPIESCISWNDSTISQQVDFAFNIFFLTYFTMQLLVAHDKYGYWLEMNSFIDYATIPPMFVGLALGRQWTGLRFVRIIRLRLIRDILEHSSVLQSGNMIRFADLITTMFSVWLAAAGFVHLIENTGDPWRGYDNSQSLTYWECCYYLVVTMSTIGYGDYYCETVLGRVFIVFFIFGALIMFASFVPEIAAIIEVNSQYSGFYHQTSGTRHIVLCGHITYESVNNFLIDFLHEDRQKTNIKCVFINRRKPDLELSALFKRKFTKVEYFQGSVMNVRDLKRVKLEHADACLILANQRSIDPDSEDASNIMRVISTKNYCTDMRVIVQLIRYNNKAFCVNLPAWSSRDQVICLSEMKLGFMASGCLAPGFSSLLANLFFMGSYDESSSKCSDWQSEYLRGTGMEVYSVHFSSAFHGLTFSAAAEKCFLQLKLLLVAITVSSSSGRSTPAVRLNPSGRGSHAITIDGKMKGFFICQSEDEAKRATYYCDSCHDSVTDATKILPCDCNEKGYHNAINHNNLKQNNLALRLLLPVTPSNGKQIQPKAVDEDVNKRVKFDGNIKDQNSNAKTELFESTGLFHWCPRRPFKDCLLTRDKNCDVTRLLRDHVIVCCFSEGKRSPMLGLCNLVMPLRASNLRVDQLRTVVLLGDYAFLEKEWMTLCNFPAVYIRAGSPLNRFQLRKVKVNRCHMCVILSSNKTMVEDPTIADKESILCTLNIKTMNFHRQQVLNCISVTRGTDIPMLTELAYDVNALLLDQDDYDDPDRALYLTQPFACGRAFAASILDSLMSTAFFNPELLSLIRTLVMGGDARELEQILAEGAGLIRTYEDQMSDDELAIIRDRCHVTLVDVDDDVLAPFAKEDYSGLFTGALKQHGILCIGLYRLINPINAASSSCNRYVITNPEASLELYQTDKVYCLMPFSKSAS